MLSKEVFSVLCNGYIYMIFFFSIRDIKSDQDSADDEKFSLDDMAKVKTG